ncbi:MAG: protein BatD [Bacteroidales bacterium]|nr:protein BatD [Bacteroidales bacterium]
MNRKISIMGLCLLLMSAWSLKAQEASFRAEAPSKVVMGQQFQLSYVFANMDPKDFRAPEFEDFEVLFGPSTSVSSSTQIIQGKRTSSVERRYTYYLAPKKEGNFTIPAATATLKKEKITSNTLSITVLPQDNHANNQSQSSGAASSQSASSTALSSENLFIRAIASKTKVYEQEAIVLTYKLYTRLDVAGLSNVKFPEYKGFMVQEIETPAEAQWDMENYKGLNYRTVVLKQNVLFPQKQGTLNIESGSFDVVVRVRNQAGRSRSIFDDFFDTYQDVNKTLTSNPVSIQVEAFPFGKPASFHPFSGSLSMTSSISATSLKADEALTLTLTLKGSGNMKMLKTPDIKFPADFDVYDPKANNQFKTSTKGVSGSKTIEYLVIPRYAGQFDIPAVEVSYFDLESKSYKTLRSEAYHLDVARSDNAESAMISGNYTAAKENVRVLGQDIRYIKPGDLSLKPSPVYIYAAAWFPWAFILPFCLFVVILLLYRKQIKANADLVRQRTRKANKVAVKRLKRAAGYLKQNDRAHFYEEVLKALWGYTSDKLNIPLSALSKDNVDAELARCQVSEEVRKAYMDILEICEFEQYAPGQANQTMDDLYAKTTDVMDKMESTIKK